MTFKTKETLVPLLQPLADGLKLAELTQEVVCRVAAGCKSRCNGLPLQGLSGADLASGGAALFVASFATLHSSELAQNDQLSLHGLSDLDSFQAPARDTGLQLSESLAREAVLHHT